MIWQFFVVPKPGVDVKIKIFSNFHQRSVKKIGGFLKSQCCNTFFCKVQHCFSPIPALYVCRQQKIKNGFFVER
jgi:hypothetical protein